MCTERLRKENVRLKAALKSSLTALGQINPKDSGIRSELRNIALSVGWKALQSSCEEGGNGR